MISKYIVINDIQKKRFEEFREFIEVEKLNNPYLSLLEGQDMPFLWSIFASNKNEIFIEVNALGFWCSLTLDEEGKIIETDEDSRWRNKSE